MNRPIIGITTPNTPFHAAYYFIKLGIWLCGGTPVPLKTPNSIHTVQIDGLIVGGGTDIFPKLFQEAPKQDYQYDHDRDEMEMAWLKKAEADQIPVLGICRGAQMMNVMHGGTLHLNVSLAYENAHYPKNLFRKIFFRKAIKIEPNSLFHRLTNKTTLRVNSMHTQSIAKTGSGFVISAKENNGVIQAIGNPAHPFYLGVQFHPEFLLYRPSMRALFRGLVRATRSSPQSLSIKTIH